MWCTAAGQTESLYSLLQVRVHIYIYIDYVRFVFFFFYAITDLGKYGAKWMGHSRALNTMARATRVFTSSSRLYTRINDCCLCPPTDRSTLGHFIKTSSIRHHEVDCLYSEAAWTSGGCVLRARARATIITFVLHHKRVWVLGTYNIITTEREKITSTVV